MIDGYFFNNRTPRRRKSSRRTSGTGHRKTPSRRRRSWKSRRNRQLAVRTAMVLLLLVLAGIAVFKVQAAKKAAKSTAAAVGTEADDGRPDLDVELLTVNPYSRPGIALSQVNGIVVHYTANPGSTAMQNRDYFEGLSTSHATKASSHFIIGLEGEIVQCIPCNEIAYASNDRNSDTISIECCIEDDTGKFNDATYQSLLELVHWLMERYDLTTDDVIRHYDVTGKMCPKYYVENPDAWEQFRTDLDNYTGQ